MKNLLKTSLFLFLITSLSFSSFAKYSDTIIFSNVIKNAGLKLDIFNYQNLQDDLPIIKTNKFFLIDTFSLPNSILFNSFKDLNYNTLFVVCNSAYEEKDLFKCSSNSFESFVVDDKSYELIKLSDSKNNEEVEIHLFRVQNLNIFVFESRIFENSTKIDLLSEYLKSINRSSNIDVDNPNITEKNFVQNLQIYLKTTTFELFLYAFLAFVLILIIGKLVVYIYNNFQNLNLKVLISLFEDLIFGSFAKDKNIKLFFISGILFYFGLFTQLVLSATGSNTSYIKNLFLNFINFNFFINFSEFKLPEILFYILTFIIIVLFITSKLEYTFVLVSNLFKKVRSTVVEIKNIKFLFIFTYLLSIILLINFSKNYSIEILAYFIVLNILVFSLIAKNIENFYSIFNKRQKIFITSITLIMVGVSIYLQNSVSYKYEILIGISDKLVSLPYKKETTEEVLFDKASIQEINYPLFIDEFLVFHPEFSKYINKNISQYEDKDDNFILVAKSSDSLIKGILSNIDILNNISSVENSKFILINQNESISDIYLNLNVDCEYKSSSNFKVKFYYLDSDSLKKSELVLGNLIGCDSISKRYSFKLPSQVVTNEKIILEFIDNNVDFIKDYSFNYEDTDNNLQVKNFEIKNNFYFFLDSYKKNSSDEIVNYFVTDRKNIFFDSSNIIENINSLKKEGLIENTFNIWSLVPYRLIINYLK